jgi:hypothetical protein
VAQAFIGEGTAIGFLSWMLGSLFSIPMSRALNAAAGEALMGMPLSYSYSMQGMWGWLAAVMFLSALASYLPARNATRLTVREVLAYEWAPSGVVPSARSAQLPGSAIGCPPVSTEQQADSGLLFAPDEIA